MAVSKAKNTVKEMLINIITIVISILIAVLAFGVFDYFTQKEFINYSA